ncbi:subtilisin-like protein [Roridomyces roridus]|uniref:tripeptidyl-peptidase II n=1 Tax=Roridomyces roridus TaxID=1738132 RepID=A0AAD7C657_9AGAR|nr:subtilisin-like protein [Roridomyces roridus]
MAALFVLASFISLAAASSAFENFVVQESRQSAPDAFAHLGPAAGDSMINLRIALPSQNVSGLEADLLDVSDPKSANYGNHLSKDEANAFLAPTTHAVSAVQGWLASKGLVGKISGAGNWISVAVNTSTANEMLAAEYQTFRHIASGRTYQRTLSYSLPSELANVVDIIHPTVVFDPPATGRPVLSAPRSRPRATPPASCAITITPFLACIQSLYNIPTTKSSFSNIAVSDLKTFLQLFRPDISSSTSFTVQTLDGGSNPQGTGEAGIEANLDIQYTVGLATGVPVVFVSVGENNQDGDLDGFLDLINFLNSETSVPGVLTVSYGFAGENAISNALAMQFCNACMALTARGTTIIFASGDAQACTTFIPAFPAGCPFITVVGSVGGVSPETGSSFSSGGFSNFFPSPSYQTASVQSFLQAQGSKNAGLFNPLGRAFPDVAAQGEDIEIVVGGATGLVAGTSASAPIFASVIALINSQRIAEGKAPLGFLNPLLYANPGMFNDITTGSNPGCGTSGFSARVGWDAVTGLGTPNFVTFVAALT